MAWLSVKDYAALKGVSERAIRKSINKLKYREVAHPSRKDQISYEIWVEECGTAEPECGTAEPECGTAEPECGTAEPECGTAEPECGTAELRNCGTTEKDPSCQRCVTSRGCNKCCRTCESKCEKETTLCQRLYQHCLVAADETKTDAQMMYEQLVKGSFMVPQWARKDWIPDKTPSFREDKQGEQSDPLGERSSHSAFNAETAGSSPARVTKALGNTEGADQEQSESRGKDLDSSVITKDDIEQAKKMLFEVIPAPTAEQLSKARSIRIQEPGSGENGDMVAATVKDNLTVEKEMDSSLRWNDRNELAAGVPEVPDLRPRIKEVPLKYKALVEARVAVVTAAMGSGDIDLWLQSFNAGLVCEGQKTIIQTEGQRDRGSAGTASCSTDKGLSLRTLYRWIKTYKDEGAVGLCPGYSIEAGRGRRVPEEAQTMLLKLLLHPNKIYPMTAVRAVRDLYRLKRIPLECSDRTMTRWVEDWRKEHLAEWTLAREGMKAFREKVNRTVLRDWTLTNVNDAWVSDGHVNEVMLIDPRDGKPKKFETVGWFDAASRMPVGMIVNITENTAAIQLSFRNACEWTGFKPLCVYTDNGLAYKSKYFRGSKRSADDIELELDGVFGRMGIQVINSQPYNAKAKIIERWWLSLQEEVERFMAGWTGNHALAKPANLKRDEKYVKGKFEHRALTLEEFRTIVEHWAIHIYGQHEHPDYPGKTRMEVYQEGAAKIPADRRISLDELNWMLLVIEKKRVTNQGITLNKCLYWHEKMVNLVGRDIIVRWDHWNIRSILVYDEKDKFICQAPLRRTQDPLVKLRDDDTSRMALEADLREMKGVEKRTAQALTQQLRRVTDATSGMFENLPEQERTAMLGEGSIMPALKYEKGMDELHAELAADDKDLIQTEGQRDRDDTAALESCSTEPEAEDEEARELAELMNINPKKRTYKP